MKKDRLFIFRLIENNPGKYYWCIICNKHFKKKEECVKHIKKKHQEVLPR